MSLDEGGGPEGVYPLVAGHKRVRHERERYFHPTVPALVAQNLCFIEFRELSMKLLGSLELWKVLGKDRSLYSYFRLW